MLYLLTIDHQQWICNSNKGLSTLMEVLSTATPVEDHRFESKRDPSKPAFERRLKYDDSGEPHVTKLKIEPLPGIHWAKPSKRRPVHVEVVTPEVMPPELPAHGNPVKAIAGSTRRALPGLRLQLGDGR